MGSTRSHPMSNDPQCLHRQGAGGDRPAAPAAVPRVLAVLGAGRPLAGVADRDDRERVAVGVGELDLVHVAQHRQHRRMVADGDPGPARDVSILNAGAAIFAGFST